MLKNLVLLQNIKEQETAYSMVNSKKDIVQQLQKEILHLQGFRHTALEAAADPGLGPVNASFPHHHFPLAAVHEFVSTAHEHTAATCGFIGGILAGLMKGGKVCVWISRSTSLFPPAMKTFGLEPDQLIFIHLPREKDMLWAMEEALKCDGLAAVVAEIQEIGFTASRRLQLAVEQSRVTGFLLRYQPRNLNTIACVARWYIQPLASELEKGMPGIGFPRWKVALLKIRNGKPGNWQMEWAEGRFRPVYPAIPSLPQQERRKTG
jgi:protein ImuA